MKKTTYRLTLLLAAASLFFTGVSVFASETDDRIESSARQSYVFRTYLDGDNIQIQSKSGIVTLTGTVSGESHKSLAGETVSSLPGVIRVENKLADESEVSTMYTDAWLMTKVKTTLFFHRNVSASSTEVLATNGTITLSGEAANEAQKALTAEYAMDVDGVKDVKNEMTVLIPALQPGEKTLGQKMSTMVESGKKMMSEKMDSVGESIDDASITAMVKTTLLYHRSTSAINTVVEVKEGVVMLGGKAKNAAEKDLATKLVSDVYGVNRVINTMNIE